MALNMNLRLLFLSLSLAIFSNVATPPFFPIFATAQQPESLLTPASAPSPSLGPSDVPAPSTGPAPLSNPLDELDDLESEDLESTSSPSLGPSPVPEPSTGPAPVSTALDELDDLESEDLESVTSPSPALASVPVASPGPSPLSAFSRGRSFMQAPSPGPSSEPASSFVLPPSSGPSSAPASSPVSSPVPTPSPEASSLPVPAPEPSSVQSPSSGPAPVQTPSLGISAVPASSPGAAPVGSPSAVPSQSPIFPNAPSASISKPPSPSISPIAAVGPPVTEDPVKFNPAVVPANVNPHVKKICDATDYPPLCLATVLPHLNGKNDVPTIINVAVTASMKYAEYAMFMGKKLAEKPGTPPQFASILSDCKGTYDDAVKTLGEVLTAVPQRNLSLMQSKLNAVLADISDCEDKFAGVATKTPFTEYSDKLKFLTNNCLDIVSRIH